jgi:hypothetical protein
MVSILDGGQWAMKPPAKLDNGVSFGAATVLGIGGSVSSCYTIRPASIPS